MDTAAAYDCTPPVPDQPIITFNEAETVIADIDTDPFLVKISSIPGTNDTWCLHAHRRDTNESTYTGRQIIVEPGVTETGLVQQGLALCLAAAEREVVSAYQWKPGTKHGSGATADSFDKAQVIVNAINAYPFKIVLGSVPGADDTWYLQVSLERVDTDTGRWGTGRGGKILVPAGVTARQLFQDGKALCVAYAEHEVREGFRYRGRRPFYPHGNVNQMGADQ